MQRAAASMSPSLRSVAPSSITPPSEGHAAAVETALHHATAQTAKFNRLWRNFFGTVWHRHSLLVGCA